MTEKQQHAIETIIAKLPEGLRDAYREAGEYAVSLGYKPTLKGAQQQYVAFNKLFPNKANRTILKIVADIKMATYAMEIRFFANKPPYPPKFRQALDEYDKMGWAAPCNSCGHCKRQQAYHIKTDDGYRKAAGCISLIHMETLSAEDIPDIKQAFKNADGFYMEFLTDNANISKDYYSGF